MASNKMEGKNEGRSEGGRSADKRRGKDDYSERRRDDKPTPKVHATPLIHFPEIEMKRFRLDVGRRHSVKPGNIVGAIANEA